MQHAGDSHQVHVVRFIGSLSHRLVALYERSFSFWMRLGMTHDGEKEMPSLYTELDWNMHMPEEIGIATDGAWIGSIDISIKKAVDGTYESAAYPPGSEFRSTS